MPFTVNDPGHVAEHNRLAQALPPGFVPASTDSPALTGTPTAPTPAVGDSSGSIATTEFVNAEFGGSAQDAAVAALIPDTGTATGAALSAAIATDGAAVFVGVQKFDHGGAVPKPVRAPTLTVDTLWPNVNTPGIETVVWVENAGATLYAVGRDGGFLKSTDSGVNWAYVAYSNMGLNTLGMFLKTSAGTLLTCAGSNQFLRSTDDGVTWTSVKTPRTNTLPLGAQSWDIDEVTGYIYFGEYTSAPTDDVIVWRSTDDGATWTAFYTFPGLNGDPATRISHVHSIQWDPVASRIVVMTGDSSPATGLYRVTSDGTTLETIATNGMLSADFLDAPRAIGIMPFPDYVAWASDSTNQPYLFRIARTEIGNASPTIERVYQLNSTSWFVCKASTDATTWLLSTSQESVQAIDKMSHLYAITDQGETCWEVGSIAAPANANAASLMPVGRPSIHGSTLYMQTRSFDRAMTWRFQMGKGLVPTAKPQEHLQYSRIWSQSSGSVVLAASGSIVFGTARAPSLATKLYVFDVGVAQQAGTAAKARMTVRLKGGSALRSSISSVSESALLHSEWSAPLAIYPVTAQADVEFVLSNNDTSPITATAMIVAAWGV